MPVPPVFNQEALNDILAGLQQQQAAPVAVVEDEGAPVVAEAINWDDDLVKYGNPFKVFSEKHMIQSPDYTGLPLRKLLGQNIVRFTHPDYVKKACVAHPVPYTIGNNTLVGIEVEVENIVSRADFPGVWQCKEDGSLRNNGVEYVTYPIEANTVPSVLQCLKDVLSESNTPEYSSRTSIHIHVNVQDMTVEQLKSFVLLYLCFESLLYAYAGNNRNKSIFCIPLSHSGYVKRLKDLFNVIEHPQSVKKVLMAWHKYTGFNLLTTRTMGTVEFRHLSGTDDVEFISNWIKLLLSLKEAAMLYKTEELFKTIADLNTNSEYYIFASNVFKENIVYLPNKIPLQDMMEKDISHIKACFNQDVALSFDKKVFEKSAFFKVHKIKIIKETIKHSLRGLSKEDLYAMLSQIEKEYHITMDPVHRDRLSKRYSEVKTMIDRMEGF